MLCYGVFCRNISNFYAKFRPVRYFRGPISMLRAAHFYASWRSPSNGKYRPVGTLPSSSTAMVQLPDFMGSARSTSCATTWNASLMTYEEWYETTLPFQQVSERLQTWNSPLEKSQMLIFVFQWCIADLQYALPTVYFSCGMIGLFILSNVLGTMRARRSAKK